MTNPTITYNVPEILSNQVDLLWAAAKNVTKKGLTDQNLTKVPFQFHHALARLTVNASKSATEANFNFIVKKITIKGGFITSDVLTLESGLWTKNGTPATVNETTPATTYTFFDVPANNTQLTTTATKYAEHVKDGDLADNYLMMIPVNFTSQAAELYVEYTTVYQGEESTINKAYFDVNTNFVQGKAYAINLEFSKDAKPIEFTVTVEDWKESTKDADGNVTDDHQQDEEVVA